MLASWKANEISVINRFQTNTESLVFEESTLKNLLGSGRAQILEIIKELDWYILIVLDELQKPI